MRRKHIRGGVRVTRAFACAVIAACIASTSLAAQVAPKPQIALHRGYFANPDVALRVMVPAGRVRIVAWERDSVDIVGSLGRNADFYSAGSPSASKFGVDARNPKDGSLAEADLTVSVPRRARVWVKMTTGAIEATGVTGELELYSVSGTIAVQHSGGVVSAESIDASVTIERSSGSLRVRTGKGNVRLADVTGTVSVATVNGSVELRGVKSPDARIETIGGGIDVSVQRMGGVLLDLQTHSGDITITLDRKYAPALDLVSRGGKVANPISSGSAKEGRVTARSFRGAINVRGTSDIEGTR